MTRIGLLSYATVRPDNLQLLREAADGAGVELDEVQPHELAVRVDAEGARVERRGEPWTCDVVVHRTVNRHLGLVVPLLELLRDAGVPVVNDPHAAVRSRNKLATLRLLSKAGLPVVPTWAAAVAPAQPPFADDALVAKPAQGVRGEGVRLVQSSGLAWHWHDEGGLGPTLLQPLVGPGRDVRAYVVGGRCVAAARRRSTGDDFRANASLGGSVEPLDPGEQQRVAELAVAAVDAVGLEVAAVDLLEGDDGALLLNEVDAWGGFAHLQRALGVPIASAVLEHAVSRA